MNRIGVTQLEDAFAPVSSTGQALILSLWERVSAKALLENGGLDSRSPFSRGQASRE